jgi:hypothetical protein
MTNFLSELKKCWSTLKIVKLTINDASTIRECVIKSLNLSNATELRDKFEGMAFYENFYQKVSGIIAVEKVLNLKLIDWGSIDPKNYSPIINLFDRSFHVVTAKFGIFPIIQQPILNPIILLIQKEEKVLWLIGYSDYYFEKGLDNFIINDFSIFKSFSNYSGFEAII